MSSSRGIAQSIARGGYRSKGSGNTGSRTHSGGGGGRGRGRGHGRGRAEFEDTQEGEGGSIGTGRGRGGSRGGGQHGKRGGKQLRPTHFLSLPLGRHNALQTRVRRFTDALLATDPPIGGLDETIIIEPPRLHITLGVMHLKESDDSATSSRNPRRTNKETSSSNQEEQEQGFKTVQEALDLLSSLRAEVVDVVRPAKISEVTGSIASNKEGLRVNLDTMGILQPDKNETAHVLWIGPEASRGPHKTTLERVAAIVNGAFRREGFITESRPLKLHCTLIKTSQRRVRDSGGADRGRGRGAERYGFSRPGIFESEAYNALLNTLPSTAQAASTTGVQTSATATARPQPNFGTWNVNEVQLCTMGSRDPNTGAYASVGGINI